MNGITILIRDRLGIALNDARLATPQWIYAWAIHPDDRPNDQVDPVELFLSGKRLVFYTIDKKEYIVALDECVQNILTIVLMC